MQRIGLIIILGIATAGLFVGISSFNSTADKTNSSVASSGPGFNAYSEGINTIFYDAEGNVNYTLQAEHQVHYNDDSTQLVKPFIRLYQNGDSHWNIVANSGRISATETPADGVLQKIEIRGDVQAYKLDEFGNRTLMSTESLTLSPDTEILETDQAVSFMTPALQQSSIGMLANLKTDEITFLRETRGQHAQATK